MFGQKKKEESDPIKTELSDVKSSLNGVLKMQNDFESRIEKKLAERQDAAPMNLEPILAPYANAIRELEVRIVALENTEAPPVKEIKKATKGLSAEEALDQISEFIQSVVEKVNTDGKK
jgi:hypothetical protein